jgi:hypothetical protein
MGRGAGRYLAILLEAKMWHPKAAGDAAPDRASNLEATNCARVESRIEGPV